MLDILYQWFVSEFELMEDWKWGGLDRLSEQSKLADGLSQKRRLLKPAESSCPIEGIDDDVCYALASITPLLGVNEQCLEQSMIYLTGVQFNIHFSSQNMSQITCPKSCLEC